MKIIHEKQQKIHNLYKSLIKNRTEENKNFPRVINTTDTKFIQEEIQLLSKGMKYNLHYKQKNWLETSTFEAETTISKLDITEQHYRYKKQKR
jgi:hypothetical protein